MAHTSISLLIVTILLVSHGIYAKRGCFSFGHSCWGGHGKRSSGNAILDSNSDMRRELGQGEIAPHPSYPRNDYALPPSGDDMIPVRDGGMYDRDETTAREVMKYKLRNLVQHWMNGYKQSQSNNGYIPENL